MKLMPLQIKYGVSLSASTNSILHSQGSAFMRFLQLYTPGLATIQVTSGLDLEAAGCAAFAGCHWAWHAIYGSMGSAGTFLTVTSCPLRAPPWMSCMVFLYWLANSVRSASPRGSFAVGPWRSKYCTCIDPGKIS